MGGSFERVRGLRFWANLRFLKVFGDFGIFEFFEFFGCFGRF